MKVNTCNSQFNGAVKQPSSRNILPEGSLIFFLTRPLRPPRRRGMNSPRIYPAKMLTGF